LPFCEKPASGLCFRTPFSPENEVSDIFKTASNKNIQNFILYTAIRERSSRIEILRNFIFGYKQEHREKGIWVSVCCSPVSFFLYLNLIDLRNNGVPN
jgi:hypothetical protein